MNQQGWIKTALLIVLGAIVAIAIFMIAVGAIIWFKNPWDLKGKIINYILTGEATTQTNGSTYDHPLLSPSQEEALSNLGVDVSAIPSSITPEMEDCLTEKLGEERAAEIKAGATPSPLDILKAKSCL